MLSLTYHAAIQLCWPKCGVVGELKLGIWGQISCFRSCRPGLLWAQGPFCAPGWCLSCECFLWAALKAQNLTVSQVSQLVSVQILCRCTLVDIGALSCWAWWGGCRSQHRILNWRTSQSAHFGLEDVLCSSLKKAEGKKKSWRTKNRCSVWGFNLNWFPQTDLIFGWWVTSPGTSFILFLQRALSPWRLPMVREGLSSTTRPESCYPQPRLSICQCRACSLMFTCVLGGGSFFC